MGKNQIDAEDGEVVETKWKETASPVLQELYLLMFDKQRDINSFHIWLHVLMENLMPNIRNLTVHYNTVQAIHNDYFNPMRISFEANPDTARNRKTQIQVLAFSSLLPSFSFSSSSSSSPSEGGDESTKNDMEKIPWDLFLQDVKYQHQVMYAKSELSGDYDCFVAYKQYARLYTLQAQENSNVRECWVNFSAERMQTFGIQHLWEDPHDGGPLFEFKTHLTMITHLLRAFAWNINIPYLFKPKYYSTGGVEA